MVAEPDGNTLPCPCSSAGYTYPSSNSVTIEGEGVEQKGGDGRWPPRLVSPEYFCGLAVPAIVTVYDSLFRKLN